MSEGTDIELYLTLEPFDMLKQLTLIFGSHYKSRALGRPRRRWMDNIKMDLLEIGMSVVGWIGLAQDRYRWRAPVNSVMNLRVP
jgi:hypothetical protein